MKDKHPLPTLLIVLLFSIPGGLFAQGVKHMYPELGAYIDKSAEGEKQFIERQKRCDALFEKEKVLGGFEKLSAAEQEMYNDCMVEVEGYWDIVGIGCSWYCGGGPDSLWASSELKETKFNSYQAANAHDLSYKTAWVEGVPGDGIGEFLVYRFKAGSPRINKIKVVNGYVKSEKTWKENSRVKKLKMYINDKPFAILNLSDSRQEQTFAFEPIGNANRGKERKSWASEPDWTMKFEIVEVYKGDKYEETALTEIYFDGLDVHCFAAGTNITLFDGKTKPIEQIFPGNRVATFDTVSKTVKSAEVTSLVAVKHDNLVQLTFEDRVITVTDDHPFYVKNHQWAAVDADRSNLYYYHEEPVIPLVVGDWVFVPETNKYLKVQKIKRIKGVQMAYTLELRESNNFFAQGLLVKTEEVR